MQVRLGEDDLQNVWVPDTFFRNEKRATFHEVTVSDADLCTITLAKRSELPSTR